MKKKFSFFIVSVLATSFLVTSPSPAVALTCDQRQIMIATALSNGDVAAAASAQRLSCTNGSGGSSSTTTLTCNQRSINIANALTRGDVSGAAFWRAANCTNSSSGGGSGSNSGSTTPTCTGITPVPTVVPTQSGSSVRFNITSAVRPFRLAYTVNYLDNAAGAWTGWSSWATLGDQTNGQFSAAVDLSQPSPTISQMLFSVVSQHVYCGDSQIARTQIFFETQGPALVAAPAPDQAAAPAPAQAPVAVPDQAAAAPAPVQGGGQGSSNRNQGGGQGLAPAANPLQSPLRAPVSVGEIAEPKGGAQISGRATQLDVAQGSANGSATLSYATPTAALKVSLLPDMGSILSSAGVSQLVLKRGHAVEFSGSNLMKDSFVQAWLPNSNSEIGRFKVGAGGVFTGEIDLKASRLSSPVPIGEQTVQFTGFDETGNQIVISAPITILQPDVQPEMVLGNTPSMPKPGVGKLINTEGGQLSEASVDINKLRNELSVVGDGWVLAVALSGSEGVLDGDRDDFQLELSKNEPVSFAGNGFMPGTVASIWLFSDPVKLGEVTVLEDGSFSGVSEEVLSSIAGGEHTLQLQGVRSDGILVSANLGVELQSGPFDFLFTGLTGFQLPEEFGVGSLLLTVFLLFQVAFFVFWYLRKSKSTKGKLGKTSKAS